MTPDQRRAFVEKYLQLAQNTITHFNDEIRDPEVVTPAPEPTPAPSGVQ